jgi:AraC family transcriptional regulator, arabinose operon regulatory protein
MRAREQDTPHRDVFQLFTGHFTQHKGYKTWRSGGTNDWLFIYTLDGKGRFGYRGGEFIASTGDAVFLKPHTLHDYGVEASLEHWELRWSHVHPRTHWAAYLQLPEIAPGLLHLHVEKAQRRKIEKRFADVHTLATSGLERREDFAMNALEEVLLLLDSINPRARRQLDPRVVTVQTYLRQHLNERVPLEQLSKVCHLSSSRLSHLFREQVGMTPLEFLEAERLERAKRLLELTSVTVQAIAAEVGFENPFYFTRRFKKYTGLSPRDFRATVNH